MEQKPIYFDGSGEFNFTLKIEPSEPLQITDEMRKNIGQNPYFSHE
jgi:hypothetical protein